MLFRSDVLEYVYFPMAKKLADVSLSMQRFFGYTPVSNIISTSDRAEGGLHLNQSMRGYTGDARLTQTIQNARSMWFKNELRNPTRECLGDMTMTNFFSIEFLDDRYVIQGHLTFPYGKYPSTGQMDDYIRQYKEGLLNTIKGKIDGAS